jgi:hypothetical protein
MKSASTLKKLIFIFTADAKIAEDSFNFFLCDLCVSSDVSGRSSQSEDRSGRLVFS